MGSSCDLTLNRIARKVVRHCSTGGNRSGMDGRREVGGHWEVVNLKLKSPCNMYYARVYPISLP